MRRAPMLLAALLLACRPAGPTPQPVTSADQCGLQPDGSRRLRVLHINDVYRIEGLADGRGGLGRLRTLRTELERECGALLVTHAGDTLYPSLLSREYDGAQMIEVLNVLDGDPEAFDANMIATFGNHEFDAGKLDDAPGLAQRVVESQFQWLDTSIEWARDEQGQPHIAADNLAARSLLELGGVRVGVFSLMIGSVVPAYVAAIDTDYIDRARAEVAALREAGAEVVIALTHLNATDDQAILDALPGAEGPDLILGGHDHVLMTLESGARSVYKGDADALRVRVVDVVVSEQGEVSASADPEGTAIGPDTPAPDPTVQALIDAHLAAFDTAFCGADGPGCLTRPLTEAKTELLAEELEIRRYETNFGDWILDRMLETFAEDGAELAFINSGSLRLNQDISPGTELTRQIVEETFAYSVDMRLIEIDGATLQAVLDRSVSDWSGGGHWLQIAGFAYRHDVEAGRALDPVLLGEGAPTPIDPARRYRVATTNYLLDASGNQDGYAMLSADMILDSPRNGTKLETVVLDALTAAGDAGIAPVFEGRICSSDRPDQPCLVP